MKPALLKFASASVLACTFAIGAGAAQSASFTLDTGLVDWQLAGSSAASTTHGGWIAPGAASPNSWIGFGDGAANATYTYSYNFTLSAAEVASGTASLVGEISADDTAVVSLNGTVIRNITFSETPGTSPWKELVDFTAAGATFGENNTLTVVVQNSGGGPTGILVSNSLVSAVPLPAAAWLFGSALIGLIAVARRRAAV